MGEKASDLEQIAETIQLYFDGMYRKDVERLRKAFHPDAHLFGYFQGNFVRIPRDEWFKMVEARPSPAESGEPYDMRIVSTDVTGAVATVKVNDLYQGLRFTDYLSLAKVDGRWAIVNKAFHHEPKA